MKSEHYEQKLERILDYLKHGLPEYPFDEGIDREFVGELIVDAPELDLLEQIKTMRWYYDLPLRKPRALIRRWIANARR